MSNQVAHKEIIEMQRKHDAELLEHLSRLCAELDDEIDKLEAKLKVQENELEEKKVALDAICKAYGVKND